MNSRRSFLATMLAAGTASLFLPGAGRHWKRSREGLYVPNPDYQNAPFEVSFILYNDQRKWNFGPLPDITKTTWTKIEVSQEELEFMEAQLKSMEGPGE